MRIEDLYGFGPAAFDDGATVLCLVLREIVGRLRLQLPKELFAAHMVFGKERFEVGGEPFVEPGV